MEKQVTLKIDGRSVTVPEGTMIVEAAKKLDIIIPVFCYHPKLKPAGMCRVCLVDVGRPQMDRITNAPMLNEDGTPKIVFGPKLETACTTPVSEGMVVWGATEKVMEARKEILEFLLTSHPLDCPICDKGGECPLQNLTMKFGPMESRFQYDEKKHLGKHIRLGELIYLDRERCIQCGRCVRFQEQIVDDPVIGFSNRGRSMEIISYSEPGFNSIFSGNTTDICPVGALTTADFRFGARPWEMDSKASICTQCPVGCNITYNTRREAKSGGKTVIKRVMPRQNEEVNEIWICDKGRFTYHYAESPDRLTTPLIRRDGELVEASWDEAIEYAAQKVKAAGAKLAVIASGRLSNEDLYTLKKFAGATGGKAILHTTISGGDWVSRAGMTPGSDLGKLENGSVILVFASDLHEEAPIWWLRVKQAAERGVKLIVANGRRTRLDKFASYTLHYTYGDEAKALAEITSGKGEIARAVKDASNLVIFYGSDGMGLVQSAYAAETLANLLIKTERAGKPNNGLIAVWQKGNDQGAWELGFKTDEHLEQTISDAMGVYIAGADPASEDPGLKVALQRAGFVIVQDLFLTDTARLADVVFPAQAVMEREGTAVSGERRLQRYLPAVPAPEGTRADHVITSAIAIAAGLEIPESGVTSIYEQMTGEPGVFHGITTAQLQETREQWPKIGRSGMYYGGTSYDNRDGLGVILPLDADPKNYPAAVYKAPVISAGEGQLLAVPVTHLYDQGGTVTTSEVIKSRIVRNLISLNPKDAGKIKVSSGDTVLLHLAGRDIECMLDLDASQPEGVILVTRSMGALLSAPASAAVSLLEPAAQRT